MIDLDTSRRVGKSLRNPKRSKVEKVEEPQESDAELSVNNVVSEESDANQSENDMKDGDLADEENMESEDTSSDDEESKSMGNTGWADAIQKILKTNKPKKKKTLVLSRAKKLSEVVTQEVKEKVSYEIKGKDGKVTKEDVEEKNVEIKVADDGSSLKRKRKDVHRSVRVKPTVLDRERERMLQKIATKGVVQLFNAVRQQQADIDKKLVEAGPLERKREKVMKSIDKRAFLDVLMGGTKSISVDEEVKSTKTEEAKEEKVDKVWSVLRDDFVMGAKLKDWDKKAPEEDDSSAPEEMDSD